MMLIGSRIGQRGRPFSLDHLPKPWRFFWGADGAAAVATICRRATNQQHDPKFLPYLFKRRSYPPHH